MSKLIRYAFGDSSLGGFIAACSVRGLVCFEFTDAPDAAVRHLAGEFPGAELQEDAAGLAQLTATLAGIVEHPERDPGIALDSDGSDFEQRVWQALREIPAGATQTYGEIAAKLGLPGAARDVGAACAANRIAILIPCHRVVKRDGGLSGYRWGVGRKRALLAREQLAVGAGPLLRVAS